MKLRSYQRATNKSIIEVKRYLLEMSKGIYEQDIHDIMNQCIDTYQLKKKLNKRKDIQLWLFMNIKKAIDHSVSFDDIENHLIYMNHLIQSTYQPLLEYKYKLFYYILDQVSFSVESYCLIRHLLKFKTKQIEQYIDNIEDIVKMDEERYHYVASEILLLEEQYKQAYHHLPYVCFDQRLQVYQQALYNDSPRRFENLFEQTGFLYALA